MLQEGLGERGRGTGCAAPESSTKQRYGSAFCPRTPGQSVIQPGITGTAPIPCFYHLKCFPSCLVLCRWDLQPFDLCCFILKGRTHPGDGETDQRHQEPCELLTWPWKGPAPRGWLSFTCPWHSPLYIYRLYVEQYSFCLLFCKEL